VVPNANHGQRDVKLRLNADITKHHCQYASVTRASAGICIHSRNAWHDVCM
jgi:hypothetical protein